jgi:hypothetical protein
MSEEICSQTRNIYFMFNRVIYEIMLKNEVSRTGYRDNMIWITRSARWVTEGTDTHTEYVIIITLPRQQRLGERALCYVNTYSFCLVTSYF